jgi:hypothetical protein
MTVAALENASEFPVIRSIMGRRHISGSAVLQAQLPGKPALITCEADATHRLADTAEPDEWRVSDFVLQ